MVTCSGLPFDISGISGTVTGPSHSPARFFMVAKDFCASDGTGATEDWCASDCAKAKVVSDSKTTDSTKRRDFMFHSPEKFISYLLSGSGLARALSCDRSLLMNPTLHSVIVNYNTTSHVKLFLISIV